MTGKRQRERGYNLPDPVDNGTRICVTMEIPNDPEYKNAVYAQLSLLGRWWNWKRDPSLSAKDVAELMRRQILDTLVFDECGATPMTCEDVENCLETSGTIAGINTNLSNSDYLQKSIGNQSRADKYTGTNQSIYPTAPNSASQNNQDSIDRLCYAVDFFVREYVEAKKSVLNLAIFGSYLNVGLTALLSTSLGGLGFIVGGSAITAEVFSIALLQEALDALSDETAVDDVICCILDYLNLKKLSETTFNNALDNNCHTGGSNADIVRQLLVADRKNITGYLYFVECVGRLATLTGIVDCGCLTVATCSGVTQNYYPTAPTYYTIPSSAIVAGGNVTISTGNFGYNTYSMLQGSYLEIEIPNPECINRIVYTSREGASGSGNASWNFSINGEVVGVGIDAHLTIGATENQNKSVFSAGSGSRKGSILKMEYPANIAVTRPIQVTNIRVGYLS